MKCPEQTNLQRQEVDQWLPGAGGRMGVTANGYRVSIWGDGNILELVVMVVQLCKYIRNITELFILKV